MKAAELKALLKDIPDDVELVVGDPDCGNYWNPVIGNDRFIRARKVNKCWAETQLRKIHFFALYSHPQSMSAESDYAVGCHSELRALCL